MILLLYVDEPNKALEKMRKLIAQAQQMQEQVASAQADLSAREFEASATGGMDLGGLLG